MLDLLVQNLKALEVARLKYFEQLQNFKQTYCLINFKLDLLVQNLKALEVARNL